jgi:hypothetical protein
MRLPLYNRRRGIVQAKILDSLAATFNRNPLADL